MSRPRSSSVPMTTGSSMTALSILSSTLGWILSGTFFLLRTGRQHSLYTPSVNLLSVALLALFTVESGGDARPSAPAPSVGPPPLAQAFERIDQLHKRRDDRVAFSEEQSLVQATLARAPQDFGVLWRAARYYFWLSDDPGLSKEERSRAGKDGWDLAERAIVANPNDVAGYYWAAVCMGNYALGLGVVKALAQGMEGKFRDRLHDAEAERV